METRRYLTHYDDDLLEIFYQLEESGDWKRGYTRSSKEEFLNGDLSLEIQDKEKYKKTNLSFSALHSKKFDEIEDEPDGKKIIYDTKKVYPIAIRFAEKAVYYCMPEEEYIKIELSKFLLDLPIEIREKHIKEILNLKFEARKGGGENTPTIT